MTIPTLTSRVRSWLNDVPMKDPVNRRMASPIQILLVGFLVIIIIAAILNLFITPLTSTPQAVVIRTFIF